MDCFCYFLDFHQKIFITLTTDFSKFHNFDKITNYKHKLTLKFAQDSKFFAHVVKFRQIWSHWSGTIRFWRASFSRAASLWIQATKSAS